MCWRLQPRRRQQWRRPRWCCRQHGQGLDQVAYGSECAELPGGRRFGEGRKKHHSRAAQAGCERAQRPYGLISKCFDQRLQAALLPWRPQQGDASLHCAAHSAGPVAGLQRHHPNHCNHISPTSAPIKPRVQRRRRLVAPFSRRAVVAGAWFTSEILRRWGWHAGLGRSLQ